MLISTGDLIGLATETKSGTHLGKVSGLVVETDSQSVYQYNIKPDGITGIFSKEFLISREQVIAISAEKLVVDDNTIEAAKKAEAEREAVAKPQPASSAILASERK